MKEKLLVSACLLGLPCRYDGESRSAVDVDSLTEKYELVPFCPEIYGGLPTPRTPSERVGDRVLMRDGVDVTENYKRGAVGAAALCRTLGCKKALLKARSPSCGVGAIYDGSFSGRLVDGNGVAAEHLINVGVAVFTENDIDLLLKS